MIDIYKRTYMDGGNGAIISFSLDGEAYETFQESELFHRLENYLQSLKQNDKKTTDKILSSPEMQSIADNHTELEVTFFKDDQMIVFKKQDWKKAYFDREFFVIESDTWKCMYNCDTIKSIKFA